MAASEPQTSDNYVLLARRSICYGGAIKETKTGKVTGYRHLVRALRRLYGRQLDQGCLTKEASTFGYDPLMN